GHKVQEGEYDSCMGFNIYTSALHYVFKKTSADRFPESYDPAVPDVLVFAGTKGLADNIEIPGYGTTTVGKLVLSPTRTYAPVIKRVLDSFRKQVHGMVHGSGGAQTKVLHFIDNLHVIKDNLFDIPPLFKLIQEESGTDWQEMYKVFNMGHRMELYVPETIADDIIGIAGEFG